MKTSQEIVNESGYPLQIYLEDLIKINSKDLIWSIQLSEHRWIDEQSTEEGFIDLVLKNKRENYRLIIECKRIIGKWNFIVPDQNLIETQDSKILSIDFQTHNYSWPQFPIRPNSYESAFCVLETDGKRDTRTLEKIASELLLSLEYYAIDETKFMDKNFPNRYPFPDQKVFYIPLIVTTADLQLIRFNPKDFDVKIGKITASKLESVQFIRYKKNLSSHIKFENIKKNYNFSDENKEYDRTIFIVHAENFIDFLKLIGTV